MKGITYFKLKSPYDGDTTKNCALAGTEVDMNFFTLRGNDIRSINVDSGKVIVNLVNGETLSTDSLTNGFVKDFDINFDEVNGELTVKYNDQIKTFKGFTTIKNIEKGATVSTDGSLVGNGLINKPVKVSPVYRTGQYRPVTRIVNMAEGQTLPCDSKVYPGDRFLTIENINEFGYLYNYEGLKKLACELSEAKSEWRIPTKEDWDDLLDAVEPNYDEANHTDARTNKFLGKFAGKILKSKKYWRKSEDNSSCPSGCCSGLQDLNNMCYPKKDHCSCNDNVCMPPYFGEEGQCHCVDEDDYSGIDKYGFNIVPAGYANEAKDFMYFKERAYFWTATNKEYRDAYIKAFTYNSNKVLQDIIASDNYLSVRLVKDYTGDNFNDREDILGSNYSTILMPSKKDGQKIWTNVNLAVPICGCDCTQILPNAGQGMEYTKKYFINEWNGDFWLRKELCDGETVVVKDNNNNNDNKEFKQEYTEFIVVKEELVNVSKLVYDEVLKTFIPIIKDLKLKLDDEIERSTEEDVKLENDLIDINEKIVSNKNLIDENILNITLLKTKIDEEIARSTNEDVKLEEDLIEVKEKIEANTENSGNIKESVSKLEKELQAEVERSTNEDVRLTEDLIDTVDKIDKLDKKLDTEKKDREDSEEIIQQSIVDLIEKDSELESKLLTNDGSNFDTDKGILTLKSLGGENDIKIQFTMNFGTF